MSTTTTPRPTSGRSDHAGAPRRPLPRMALAVVAAVLALGLVGMSTGVASASAVEPTSVETSGVAYAIEARGMAIVDEFGIEFAYAIEGGELRNDGTGVIHLSGGQQVDIISSMVRHEVLILQAEYTGFFGNTTAYAGMLDAVEPGWNIFEGELVDQVFGNEIAFEMPGLMLTPVR